MINRIKNYNGQISTENLEERIKFIDFGYFSKLQFK